MVTRSIRSALEGLRAYYDTRERVCTACGFEVDEGSWVSETNGSVVMYHYECPSCHAVMEHTVTLSAA
ncbi:hypothetical protein JCM30237_04020 [Halolamina litorea]|uniref:HVO_0649 family zinc finger protein n=1 Tax=Halolamina litorea TaxID=1515593 RepID=A0ABD6BQB1_9EURY|nr:HVO_0649 family zinc finger protein [Halolamina litorea]